MLQLILLRHAKTDQFSETGKDFDRKLLPRGINQGKELALYFKNNNFPIEEVYVSTAVRTKETFLLFENVLRKHEITYSEDLYLCDAVKIFDLLSSSATSKTVLIVGHNYGISDLASYLSGQTIDLATSELIRMSFDIDNWNELSRDQAKIIEMYRPSAL